MTALLRKARVRTSCHRSAGFFRIIQHAPTNFSAPFLPPTATAAGFGGTLFESADWYNAFVAATWNVTNTFRVNLGGRYQNVSKDGRLPATYAALARDVHGKLQLPGKEEQRKVLEGFRDGSARW